MATYTYPGVYVEEIPSGVRTITGVSTSDTAFVGYFQRGPMNEAVRISSFADFDRRFGGLFAGSDTSYAVQQYYLNGGQIAWVVRVADGALPALINLPGDGGAATALELAAASPGLWGNNVQVAIGTVDADHFNLVAREVRTIGGRQTVVNSETFLNLSMDDADPRYVVDVINEGSALVHVNNIDDTVMPDPSGANVTNSAVINDVGNAGDIADFGDPGVVFIRLGSDGALTAADDGSPPGSAELIAGMNALENIAPFIFNILCLPEAAGLGDADDVYDAANTFCEARRAFLLVDIGADVDTPDDVTGGGGWLASIGDSIRHRNAAVYFPRLEVSDALNENRPRNLAASGTVAGIFARTDASRGVWKAPAGTEASLRGATPVAGVTDLQNGDLNQSGVNVLRTFPIFGHVSWGARTLVGADQMASEWKYIPVRRTALYIEESLFQGLKWVVFEPNDEPLWAQIRLNVGAFMNNLFRQGAFAGLSPREAYFVKCDKETTTQNDINLGIVNIIVGFAPLKPAEFVVIKIQQIAGQIQV